MALHGKRLHMMTDGAMYRYNTRGKSISPSGGKPRGGIRAGAEGETQIISWISYASRARGESQRVGGSLKPGNVIFTFLSQAKRRTLRRAPPPHPRARNITIGEHIFFLPHIFLP